MSDEPGTQDIPAGSPAGGGPRPEPIRYFGTAWVNHDKGYALRRVGAAAGSLAATVASCLILRFAYEGLQIADTGSFVSVLVIAMFAICGALAFRNTWDGFGKHPDPDRQASLRGLLAIGFVGSLLAYFFRTFVEAPGEGLRRKEYEAARREHEKRGARRTGNPAKKNHRR
ncbi:EamA/RhaT family transporter [Streptomyces sp. NPDC001668]|uniref:EamA/RhaT family transporter n=1 Tax=unclassified Streptomyces TaxID=2593676 RepID=UPI0036CB6B65